MNNYWINVMVSAHLVSEAYSTNIYYTRKI